MMDLFPDTNIVAPAYRASARIDLDLDRAAIDNFILHETGWRTLERLFSELEANGGVAATWTGPYGSGKSTLALFLTALLSGDDDSRAAAEAKLGLRRLKAITKARDGAPENWMSIRVIGRRDDPGAALFDAVEEAARERWPRAKWLTKLIADADLFALLEGIGGKLAEEQSGLLLIVDEMGKFLEAAAETRVDLMTLQDLAERAVRGACPTIFLGVLHQAFDEYARPLGGLAREEWAKIQGRFTDSPFSLSVDETVSLISSTLKGRSSEETKRRAKAVLGAVDGARIAHSKAFEKRLSQVAPLDPMTALMLGPMSRRRFGQNERSIFSFLGSGEPFGLQDHIRSSSGYPYPVDALWDYLHHNFHSAILASGTDGRLWAESADAVSRAERLDDPLAVRIAKVVSLLEMFGRAFGLIAKDDLLRIAIPETTAIDVTQALERLNGQSIIVHRQHLGGWCIYGGSDIDLDKELERGLSAIGDHRDATLASLPALRPVVAKRHYHETGTMRWFERIVCAPANAAKRLALRQKKSSASGFFVLCLASDDDDMEAVVAKLTASANDDGRPALAAIARIDDLIATGAEYAAWGWVRQHKSELAGDRIARTELAARKDACERRLYETIEHGFNTAEWRRCAPRVRKSTSGDLSRLASEAADKAYMSAPHIFNELINRNRVSGNVAGARRKLMYAMIHARRSRDLGIEGFPPEKSIYLSLLLRTGMHGELSKPGRHDFLPSKDDRWEAVIGEADRLLNEAGRTPKTAQDLYDMWSAPPFGLKRALLPIILLYYTSLREDCVALYQDGYYAPDIGPDQIDALLQQPEKSELKWIETDGINRDLLIRIARFVEESFEASEGRTALEVTKPLVQFALRLPPVVKRTASLSERTRRLRDSLVQASDPFLLLFQDLPKALGLDEADEGQTSSRIGAIVQRLSEAVAELLNAEETILDEVRDAVFSSLGVVSTEGYQTIVERAVAVPMETGDEQLNGFIARLRSASDRAVWAQAIGALAAEKPYKSWSDADVAAAKLRIAELGRRFSHVEAFVAARSASSGTLTYALTVEDGGVEHRATMAEAMRVRKADAPIIDKAADHLLKILQSEGFNRTQARAALIRALCNDHAGSQSASVSELTPKTKGSGTKR
ncbi:MAG: hypothetical protein AAFR11_04645 [Pseudomonadota bacterium]